MADINVFTLTGRLTKDCETRTTPNGTMLARFSIASNYYSSSAKKEEVSYFDCVMFGKLAENLAVYMKTGTAVTICGELRQQRFEVGGEKKSKVELIVSDVKLAPKPESKPETPAPAPKTQNNGPRGPEAFDDSDIPF